jgi:hypothetical protein
MRVKLYKILENKSKYELAIEVEGYLKKGWELQGGVSVVATAMSFYYCQAITLE